MAQAIQLLEVMKKGTTSSVLLAFTQTLLALSKEESLDVTELSGAVSRLQTEIDLEVDRPLPRLPKIHSLLEVR